MLLSRALITSLPPNGLKAREVEVLQPHLRRPRVVEALRAGEVHGEPLGKRRQSLHPLRSLEERGGPCDHEVEAREAARVDLVDYLPEGIQALLSHVAPHALECLDLVQYEHEPREARVAQDDEQALEEAECAEVVEVALDARVPLGGGADVGLPADPGQQRLGHGAVVPGDGPSIGAERRCKRRSVAGNLRETPFHEVGRPGEERLRVTLRDVAFGEDVFLQRVEPVVEDGPEGARLGIGG